jgi:hypothetical protein
MRAVAAETRATALSDELGRVVKWRNWALIAVLVLAVIAVIVLGSVAFNAVDDANAAGPLTSL